MKTTTQHGTKIGGSADGEEKGAELKVQPRQLPRVNRGCGSLQPDYIQISEPNTQHTVNKNIRAGPFSGSDRVILFLA
jgi:hypothetical protein